MHFSTVFGVHGLNKVYFTARQVALSFFNKLQYEFYTDCNAELRSLA